MTGTGTKRRNGSTPTLRLYHRIVGRGAIWLFWDLVPSPSKITLLSVNIVMRFAARR